MVRPRESSQAWARMGEADLERARELVAGLRALDRARRLDDAGGESYVSAPVALRVIAEGGRRTSGDGCGGLLDGVAVGGSAEARRRDSAGASRRPPGRQARQTARGGPRGVDPEFQCGVRRARAAPVGRRDRTPGAGGQPSSSDDGPCPGLARLFLHGAGGRLAKARWRRGASGHPWPDSALLVHLYGFRTRRGVNGHHGASTGGGGPGRSLRHH